MSWFVENATKLLRRPPFAINDIDDSVAQYGKRGKIIFTYHFRRPTPDYWRPYPCELVSIAEICDGVASPINSVEMIQG